MFELKIHGRSSVVEIYRTASSFAIGYPFGVRNWESRTVLSYLIHLLSQTSFSKTASHVRETVHTYVYIVALRNPSSVCVCISVCVYLPLPSKTGLWLRALLADESTSSFCLDHHRNGEFLDEIQSKLSINVDTCIVILIFLTLRNFFKRRLLGIKWNILVIAFLFRLYLRMNRRFHIVAWIFVYMRSPKRVCCSIVRAIGRDKNWETVSSLTRKTQNNVAEKRNRSRNRIT